MINDRFVMPASIRLCLYGWDRNMPELVINEFLQMLRSADDGQKGIHVRGT